MGLRCKLFGHKFNGCKCEHCGEVRDASHRYQAQDGKCAEKCALCGKVLAKPHTYRSVKDKCLEKCAVCGDERVAHKYVLQEGKCLEKCSICGTEKAKEHTWQGNTCSRCGEAKPCRFPRYTGSGVCDVCNAPLGSITAYRVPNDVFYASSAYKNHFCSTMTMFGIPRADALAQLAMQAAKDKSPGSAVCENCIHMF